MFADACGLGKYGEVAYGGAGCVAGWERPGVSLEDFDCDVGEGDFEVILGFLGGELEVVADWHEVYKAVFAGAPIAPSHGGLGAE